MNITFSSGNLPQTKAIEQQKAENDRLSRVKEATFERFRAAMPDGKIDSAALETIRQLEKISLSFNKKLQFVVDQKSEQVMVKVIDANTDKVIKILPPKELQRLNSRIKEDIGFLFDETV
jgi:flagellar protein FlaG